MLHTDSGSAPLFAPAAQASRLSDPAPVVVGERVGPDELGEVEVVGEFVHHLTVGNRFQVAQRTAACGRQLLSRGGIS